MRLEDLVNGTIIQKICDDLGHVAISLRDAYLNLQDDVDENWSFSNALHYIGLANISGTQSIASRSVSDDELKMAHSALLVDFSRHVSSSIPLQTIFYSAIQLE